MKHRAPWWPYGFAVIAPFLLLSAGAECVCAQTPPPWTISVSGQPVTLTDIWQAMVLEFARVRMQPVVKNRAQMPDTVSAEAARESAAAHILVALDAGQGGPTWQRLYHALPDDPAKRNAFAGEMIDAFKAASAWTVAKSTADRRWIFANVHAGWTRQEVYALLDSRGLKAADLSEKITKPPSGLAYVDLPGAFEPGCSFTHRITVTFDAGDRVRKLDLNPPHPNCL